MPDIPLMGVSEWLTMRMHHNTFGQEWLGQRDTLCRLTPHPSRLETR
jgi:hypothetical protein